MSQPELFTLSALIDRAIAALQRMGQDNGKVQAVPDVRMVRYYTGLGLVDRPTGWRGRTALYGRRQVLQIATIKRLQAKGLGLVRIQELLLAADDERLVELGGLAAEELSAPSCNESAGAAGPAPSAAPPTRSRSAFWSDVPSADEVAPDDAAATGPAIPPPLAPRALLRLELPGGATLELPAMPLDHSRMHELTAALEPLRAWLERHHPDRRSP